MEGLHASIKEAGVTAVGVEVVRFRASMDMLVVETACVKVIEAGCDTGRELGVDTGTVEVPFKVGDGVIWEDEDERGRLRCPKVAESNELEDMTDGAFGTDGTWTVVSDGSCLPFAQSLLKHVDVGGEA